MKNNAIGGGFNPNAAGGDKNLRLALGDTLKLAWADPELKSRLMFVLYVFAIYAFCLHVPVPMKGVDPAEIEALVSGNGALSMLNLFGGKALQKISIIALGLGPYITASIIMQIMNAANPAWKAELKEGGEYARKKQNQRTKGLALLLCVGQGYGLMTTIAMNTSFKNAAMIDKWIVVLFWTTGAMLMLWLGEQLSERGIGNGMSMLIFCGIVISFPTMIQLITTSVQNGNVSILPVIFFVALFVACTWVVVLFTIAQRRIPIQHARRQMGTKVMGGGTSYLPLSINLVGVIPIIFAISLVYIPYTLANMTPQGTQIHNILMSIASVMSPNFENWRGLLGVLIYTGLIFFFTYFYTAIQYNVDDIADNLRRGGSMIPGIRPGKQTRDFLDGVITRITIVGACFLAVVSLSQYVVPLILPIQGLGMIFGTSLLIMVSVALETIRQLEANLLAKQYGN